MFLIEECVEGERVDDLIYIDERHPHFKLFVHHDIERDIHIYPCVGACAEECNHYMIFHGCKRCQFDEDGFDISELTVDQLMSEAWKETIKWKA